jgi:AcrR family transcriptional regulator
MTAEFLWGTPTRPTRGPKPALTLDRIADAAVRIADVEGLGAVSMQRVAAELGFTKMALYRYVPGKAELVALMVERALGEPPALDAEDWRTGLRQWSHRLLAGFRRHPWALEATVGPRPLGPNQKGWVERAVALLAGTGLTGAERLDTVAALAGQVRTIAQQAPLGEQPEQRLVARLMDVLRDHGDRFPALAAALRSTADDGGRDEAFDFGLDRILDGLAVLMAARGGGRAG